MILARGANGSGSEFIDPTAVAMTHSTGNSAKRSIWIQDEKSWAVLCA